LTTATGFVECKTDAECGNAKFCSRSKYCLPFAERCEPAEGPFDKEMSIPLVALLPLSDNGASFESEPQRLNAMRLAVQQVNRVGGIQGRLFTLYSCNTDRNPAILEKQLDWAVREVGAPAVFTSGSAQTETAANNRARIDAKTLVVSATATSAALIGLFNDDKSIWRIAPSDNLQAKVMAGLIKGPIPDPKVMPVPAGSNVVILYDNSSYGSGFARSLAEQLTGYTVKLRLFDSPFATSKIQDLIADQPKLTAVIGFPNDVRTIVTAAANKLQPGHRWLFSDGGKSPAVIDANTSAELNEQYGTAPAQGRGPLYSFFKGQFRDVFGRDTDNYAFISHSYDAAYVVMLASAWAVGKSPEVTGEKLSEGMQQLSTKTSPVVELTPDQWSKGRTQLLAQTPIDVQGASGELDFIVSDGAPKAPYEIWQIKNNAITNVSFVSP
jgi:branched-chain amino acid transport system substrate-binding protein